jgi:5-methylcytosine-specific restriction protein B
MEIFPNKHLMDKDAIKDKPTRGEHESNDIHYWTYSPGENACMWKACQEGGIMCLDWEALGDLSKFQSKAEITEALQTTYAKPDSSCKNNTLALWQFAHEMKPGDVVYAKKGLSQVIGRGIVESDYIFNPNSSYPNIRRVRWTQVGEWTLPGHATKRLTDITPYPDYVKKLEDTILNVHRCWWLVANPKMWSMAELPVGETVEYGLYNENGKQRRIFQNLLDAREGDKVIGYESTPRRQIVAFVEVSRAGDGKTIEFRKTESLPTPIDCATLKEMPELAHMQFFTNTRGSFFALTDEEYECICEVISESNPCPKDKIETIAYTKADFLSEVYMDSHDYDRLVKLLTAKKNIILQGAPGVGKTFTAKKLAYAMMGEKDDSRIEMVQFHQNYTYEDFIMGYKPDEAGGFRLEPGLFYKFCRLAQNYPDKEYFFIIDEINRGNLSKIFGELLMLIENNYRGADHKLTLAYSHEAFYVPENLYIIGMMNTADRSLAMIDYALRRRFSFCDMTPGFESEGFEAYRASLDSELFDRFIDAIVRINEVIAKDDSLGAGFCIGHSYFCGQERFDKEWLTNVLEYDIAPMLREYWFDDVAKYESQVAQLRKILQ